MGRSNPANSEVVSELVRARIAAAKESTQIQPSIEVTWRDGIASLPVITMPVDQLLFNPETHRIKAQRDYDALGDRAIHDDPWGETAQKYLSELLAALPIDPGREDPAFLKLQEDLKEYGQKEPGIITPEGILINGNSRCAAIRRIDVTNMRVAVLPSDWTWDDISLLELDLQMRRELRRDYSFINLLLAIDESVSVAGSDQTAKAFRLKRATVDRNQWILAILRDLVARSASDKTDATLNLRDFETDQGKLEELYRTYSRVHSNDPVAANQLKEARLLALLLDKSKTDLRFVGDDFLENYLTKNLPVGTIDSVETTVGIEIPGLGMILPTPQLNTDLTSLVSKAARARAAVKAPEIESQESGRVVLEELNSAMERAIDSAGRDERLKKRKSAAVDKLNLGTDTLESCIEEIAIAKSKNALDEDALNDALLTLEEVMGRLAKSVLKTVVHSGDGFTWLSNAYASE